MTSPSIYNRLKSAAPDIFDKTPVLFAYLYGSYAHDAAHRFSDVDIAVFVDRVKSSSLYRLEMDLGLAFDKHLDRGVSADVRSLNTLPLPVVGEVVTFGRLIYSRNEIKRVDFEVLTRKLYFDFRHVIQQYQREALNRMHG